MNEHTQLTKTGEEDIKKALDKRNYLAHHFFSAHQGKANDKSELEIMKKELIEMSNLFNSISKDIVEESEIILQKVSILPKNGKLIDLEKHMKNKL